MNSSIGRIFLTADPPAAHVRAHGELDLATSSTLSTQLGGAVAAGCRDFRVDLSEVTFCDAGTVGVLVALDRRLRDDDGSLRIVRASYCVRRVFDLVGLGGMLEPTPTPPAPPPAPSRSRPRPLRVL